MKLEPTCMEYHYTIQDDSGYKYTVTAIKDEWGWAASVSFDTWGLRTPEDAVKRLQPAAEHLLRQLKELEND